MATLNEGRHAGEFLLSEGGANYSREAGVIVSGAGKLAAGTVLGRVQSATVTVAKTDVSGAGKGVLTLADPAFAAGVKPGVYRVICIEPATNGGTFSVEDPDGVVIGTATVGVAFDGLVKFTIADGATDFVAGDTALVTVTVAASARYTASPATGTNGTQVAVAVLLDTADATSADAPCTVIVRHAQVNGKQLAYAASVDDDAKKAAKAAQLAAVGIIVR